MLPKWPLYLFQIATLTSVRILPVQGSAKISNHGLNSISWRFAEAVPLKPVTDSDLLSDQNIADWKPPFDFLARFPYFLSGYDDDSRPIWILESGKWNIQQVVEAGEEQMDAFEMYTRQMAFNLLSSIQTGETNDDGPLQWVGILDYEHLNMAQLASLPTIQFLLKLQRQYQAFADAHTAELYIVNANYAAETLIELTRSVANQMQDRVEIYGTNRDKWVPELVQKLPRKALPQKYGGPEGFKPARVFV